MRLAGKSFGQRPLTLSVVKQLTGEGMEREILDLKWILQLRIVNRVQYFGFPFGKKFNCAAAAQPIRIGCSCRTATTTIEEIYMSGDNPYRLRRVPCHRERRPLHGATFRSNRLLLSCGLEESATGCAGVSPSRVESIRCVDRDERQNRADDA